MSATKPKNKRKAKRASSTTPGTSEDPFSQEVIDDANEQVQVRFVTRLPPELRVMDTPISLPAKFTRFALSELVNHLLELKPPRIFDFIISNELLRNSLKDYMKLKELSSENVLTLEYIEATPLPKKDKQTKSNDWISSVYSNFDANEQLTVVGSYDNCFHFYSKDLEKIFSHQAHKVHLTSILAKKTEENYEVITASVDHSVKLWKVNLETQTTNLEVVFKGHTDSVSGLCFDPAKKRFCSSSWDNTIQLWSVTDEFGERKTQKAGEQAVQLPFFSLTAHTQSVLALDWKGDHILSGSYDLTLRFWDIFSGAPSHTLKTKQAVTCVALDSEQKLGLSGHSHGVLHLWDFRVPGGEIKQTMISHRKWATGVQFHPTKPNYFVSCAQDGAVKLWDIRSHLPVHTLSPQLHPEKCFALAWKTDDAVVVGCETTVSQLIFSTTAHDTPS